MNPDAGARVISCGNDSWACLPRGQSEAGICSGPGPLWPLGFGIIETSIGLLASITSSVAGSTLIVSASITPTVTSNPPGSSPPDSPEEQASLPSSDRRDVKIGAGVGISLGLLLIGSIIYITCLRRRQRIESRKTSLHHGGDTNEPTPIACNEPQMLDAHPLQRSYSKPELSEEARRHVVELSTSQTAELSGVGNDYSIQRGHELAAVA